MTNLNVDSPLTLTNGQNIKNRLFKAAMSEALASKDHNPNEYHQVLYRKWAEGGSGIVVTGNVMVDRNALGEPGNVVLDSKSNRNNFISWSNAGTVNNTNLWMQLNHPGRQSPKSVSAQPVAPSAVPFDSNLKQFFNPPRELTKREIDRLIEKFGEAAQLAKETGFSGVQIHGAHGYLVSQFLSPITNRRTDEFGGDLTGRMLFLKKIYLEMRRKAGETFPIGLKLNISDFTEGGFNEKESLTVMKKMSDLGIDLIEISGGNYDNPKMFKASSDEEVFFIDYVKEIRHRLDTLIVITGGFRKLSTMEKALNSHYTDMIGLARPLALKPELSNALVSRQTKTIELPRLTTGLPAIDDKIGGLIGISYYEQQMARIAEGKEPEIYRNAWKPIVKTLRVHGLRALTPRRSK
ncbi:MAG: NADH:flavin oxidoreductase/NADH oxidase family protein [Alkalibacterium sp.]|nr:NADH:flavin oxidoreductase/NADH oxidase family protein [Alkalibacterium sp.]TVP91841.1 MAG: NADH:flavin oxidoreductase/NADH oxidase family protein [Alkalibacterium sp.]